MKEYICKQDLINNINEGLITSYFGHDAIEVMAEIEYMPAADVTETVYGEWVYDRTYYEADECYCSICNQFMTTARGVRMNYCPNCGANMKGKK